MQVAKESADSVYPAATGSSQTSVSEFLVEVVCSSLAGPLPLCCRSFSGHPSSSSRARPPLCGSSFCVHTFLRGGARQVVAEREIEASESSKRKRANNDCEA